MSTGKRLAKRSILGTRVVAQGEDGFYYCGLITGVKSPRGEDVTRYTVRFEPGAGLAKTDYTEGQLIGPGFQSVLAATLKAGQRVYITYNGRETPASVSAHAGDQVVVTVSLPSNQVVEIQKRLEDVRLAECRKSARLQDQDTDYSRLADMAGERRRQASHSIDVPPVYGSRKRRTSGSQEDRDECMDECTAAMVLMHLSCSPHSPTGWVEPKSPSSDSWRSGTPSPPLSDHPSTNWLSTSDEGIVMDDDFDELPKKKKIQRESTPIDLQANRSVFKCMWPRCNVKKNAVSQIEAHVRVHLGPTESDEGIEEFYYTEVEMSMTSPTPTLSHLDMVRPPHEDPEYQKALGIQNAAHPIMIPKTPYSWSVSTNVSPMVGQKQMKLSTSAPGGGKYPQSPRRVRGETKKCRKVYGMEHRDLWCTQCKWKKACSRFGD